MSGLKKFGAFVKQAAKLNIRAAKSVCLYVKERGDSKSDITARVDSAFKEKLIDADYKNTLHEYIEGIAEAHQRFGKFVDERDPKDWESLGNGARRKKTHIEPETTANSEVLNA